MHLTALRRALTAGPRGSMPQLEATVATLRREIAAGVDSYGHLVAAAGEAVSASSSLTGGTRPGVEDPTERLRALAAGMRELTAG